MTVKEIRGLTKLSQKKFAEMYGIPQRTLEAWEMGEREPAPYILTLLEKAVRSDGEFKIVGHFTTGREEDVYTETFKNEDEFKYVLRKINENEACRAPEIIIGKVDKKFIPQYLKDWYSRIEFGSWVVPEYRTEDPSGRR